MDRAAKTTAAQKDTQIKEAVKTEVTGVKATPAKAAAKPATAKPAVKKAASKPAAAKKTSAKKAPAKKAPAKKPVAPKKSVIAATHPQVLGMIEYEQSRQMIDQNAEVRPDLRVEIGDAMPVYYF